MISCGISKQMVEKIHFFHEKYKGREWSGPAWFRYALDEHGYPTALELIYFHVIDIATAAETEWTQAAFSGVFPDILAMFIREGIDPTTLMCGNIHSHHQMRAYFSGTDTHAMEEHAPDDGFWISVIVSTSGDESKTINNKQLAIPTNRCGAISYKGRFNRPVIDYNMDVFDELHNFDKDAFKDEINYAVKHNRLRNAKDLSTKQSKGGTRYTPLDRLTVTQMEEVLEICQRIAEIGIDEDEKLDGEVANLFKYFEYYWGVECALSDGAGLLKDEIERIKKRMGWDYGYIPQLVKDKKAKPKDSKPYSGYSPNSPVRSPQSAQQGDLYD